MALPSMAPAVTYLNQTLIPSLPNDVSISILARVPRSQHPSLSLVSKSFYSLLSSPHFFTIRSLINSTEASIFISLCSNEPPFNHHLYTLHHGHLVGLPPIPCCRSGSAYATHGPYIYVLGGITRSHIVSNDVWIFDCRFNKWARGPSMHAAKRFPTAGVVDGKLYVRDWFVRDVSSSVEAYDPNTGTWEVVVMSLEESKRMARMYRFASSTVVGRKIYAPTPRGVDSYDVGTRVWEFVDCGSNFGGTRSCCVVNGVLYFNTCAKKLIGFDLEERCCKEVRGVNHLQYVLGGKLVNFKGSLVMFSEKRKKGKNVEVQCIKVDVNKDENGELYGKVCFDRSVLSFPAGFTLRNCLLVTF